MVEFFVQGFPKPGGSKRAFCNKKTGKTWVKDMSDNADWKAAVRQEALRHCSRLLEGPLYVRVTFFLMRPKGHHGKRGLKPSAPDYPTGKPDATKLWRSTEDALTGIAWKDDSQIVSQHIFKRYGTTPGAMIEITLKV